MTDLLFLDVETGGLSPATDALLEVGLVHWRDGAVLDTLNLSIRSDGRRVDPEALRVNGIDVAAHDRTARHPIHAAAYLCTWIGTRWPGMRPDPAGHNVPFDLGFLQVLLGRERYGRVLGRRAVDTCAILRFVCEAELVTLPRHSLDMACAHFGIRRERAHRALDDALAAAELYGHLLAVVRGRAA